MGVAAGWHLEAALRRVLLFVFLVRLGCHAGAAVKTPIGDPPSTCESAGQCLNAPPGSHAATLLQLSKPSGKKEHSTNQKHSKKGHKKGNDKKDNETFQPYVNPPNEEEVPEMTPLTTQEDFDNPFSEAASSMAREITEAATQAAHEEEEQQAAMDREAAKEEAEASAENPNGEIWQASEEAQRAEEAKQTRRNNRRGALGSPEAQKIHEEEQRKLEAHEEKQAAQQLVHDVEKQVAEHINETDFDDVARGSEDIQDEIDSAKADAIASVKAAADAAEESVPGSWQAGNRLPGAWGIFNPLDTTTSGPTTTPKPYCPPKGRKCFVLVQFPPGRDNENKYYKKYLYSFEQYINVTKFEHSNAWILDFGTKRPRKCCQTYSILKASPDVQYIKMDIPIYPPVVSYDESSDESSDEASDE